MSLDERKIKTEGLESSGRFYSFYQGTCRDVADPLGLGRIKVEVPEVSSIVLPNWAIPKGVLWGVGQGETNVPIIGTPLLVEFRHGDVNHPYYSHGSPLITARTSSAVPQASPAIRVWETQAMLLQVVEATGVLTLKIKPLGPTLTLDLAAGKASLQVPGGLQKVELTSAGMANLLAGVFVNLGSSVLLPTAGVATGETICPFTRAPHIDVSVKVRASKV